MNGLAGLGALLLIAAAYLAAGMVAWLATLGAVLLALSVALNR